MSRVAKSPITVPSGVTVKKGDQSLSIKGPKGEMAMAIHPSVEIAEEDNSLKVAPLNEDKSSWAMAGTMRALVNNMVTGVTQGFEKKLQLVGVGYRAQAGGKSLNLNLGFSHPIDYPVPEGISIATPSATEIVVSGSDKQRVGQVAAEIRAFRPPEPYKGKGVRYVDEYVARKEAKKK
ncbi:MAG: 50S ribosomal protein L6 [gamma proteobacterium symbiont of Ctena orbiculata]|uniref:Large ribosomal subunit protein uL6 n=1 Tax=Candidatus Thiodiazotropha taylori TaxID=2792791 RepID=A0A944QVB6_9GAMM|nr:50S ribosomal protein L6 [Candidatus Thiodiazotropha taylori]PUB86857.1 MAG: 50S ribosomal protein L6 [gamma proteobacterium symbiont of Ctena orbiculata]MBT2989825.1 50S ribosomal protein L6 [Candidatus Thiodiazotropha taylori]MBT2995461.1 50S ribosomal protein L6 [Candidatus Thiodiazotropha taylori]MBT3001535.1 50S ribosomal protein L6 [Candidatus Thiodiazotropha taylori]